MAGAETLAKAALVLGPQRGAALLRQRGATGLLILDGGALVRVGLPDVGDDSVA